MLVYCARSLGLRARGCCLWSPRLLTHRCTPTALPRRRFDGALVMSRCNACNAAAFELVQPREAARSLVPARVFEVGRRLGRCPAGQ